MENMGNKAEVVRMILDIVTYIEEEQNSEDMKMVRDMLVRISSTVLAGLANQGLTVQKEQQTGCDNPDCDCKKQAQPVNCNGNTNNRQITSNGVLPDVDLNDTIAKIREEIRGEETATDEEN